MTYSLGFRAPRLNDMLSRWLDVMLEQLDPELFYADPQPFRPGAPGEIPAASYAAALAQLKQAIDETPVSPDWFGELVTETGSEPADPPQPGERVQLAPGARLAWRRSGEALLTVYANGESLQTAVSTQPVLEKLCSGATVTMDCGAAKRALLEELAERGCLQNE